MKARHRADVPDHLISISEEQHATIKRLGVEKNLSWSERAGEYVDVISKFRQEMKQHYFISQRRRCCYCSIELHDHKMAYDAEHILDKSEYVEYMFEPANLAAACKLCNGSKSDKQVSVSGARFKELSRASVDYAIIHPHLDEWSDHLEFDLIGRIMARGGSNKGRETISICGIHALNAARLADEFAVGDYKDAELALRSFHEESDLSRKKAFVELLQVMAGRYDHAGSKSVLKALTDDVVRLEEAQHDPAVAPLVG